MDGRAARFRWSDELLKRPDLPLGCKVVGQYLANRADRATGQSYPSQSAIAVGTALTVRGVQKALDVLKTAGLVEIVGQHGDDPRYATHIYRLAPGTNPRSGLTADPGTNERSPLRGEPQFTPETNPGTNTVTIQGRTPVRTEQIIREQTIKSTPTEYAAAPRQPPSKNAKSKPKKPRARNVLWDAVCDTFKLAPKTRSQCTRVGKRAKEFEELGATPEEIEQRAQRHRTTWPECECSPESLLKWWNRFGKPVRPDWMPEPAKGVDEE